MPDFGELENCTYCVIGDPIGHSLSPQMQNAAFAACGLAERYGKIRVPLNDLPEFAAFARERLKGFNITVPHKNHILPLLDWIDPAAKRCGSVNTVKVENGRLAGFSTDGDGVEGALRYNFKLEIPGRSFLMIGAGGAAHAAIWHLAEQRAACVYLANRTAERAEQLANEVRAGYPALRIEVGTLTDAAFLHRAAQSASALIQCSSCGLKDGDGVPFDPAVLDGAKLAVFDFIYRRTALLDYAATHHLAYCDGSDMLVYQGAKSFEIWTGKQASVSAMKQALMKGKKNA